MIPTVGFNMRKITKGNVTIKVWDIGGQPRFRSMWERYCRGVNAIVYMVDAADPEKIEASRNELHNLLDKPQLSSIPVLVLGNKRDLPHALDENGLIDRMWVYYKKKKTTIYPNCPDLKAVLSWHVFSVLMLQESLRHTRSRNMLLQYLVQRKG